MALSSRMEGTIGIRRLRGTFGDQELVMGVAEDGSATSGSHGVAMPVAHAATTVNQPPRSWGLPLRRRLSLMSYGVSLFKHRSWLIIEGRQWCIEERERKRLRKRKDMKREERERKTRKRDGRRPACQRRLWKNFVEGEGIVGEEDEREREIPVSPLAQSYLFFLDRAFSAFCPQF